MACSEILNLIALIVIPIIAVVLGYKLQDRAEKRKDKMQVFKAVMTFRYGWSKESVEALNSIPIVFSGKCKDSKYVIVGKSIMSTYAYKSLMICRLSKETKHFINYWKIWQTPLAIRVLLLGKRYKIRMFRKEW